MRCIQSLREMGLDGQKDARADDGGAGVGTGLAGILAQVRSERKNAHVPVNRRFGRFHFSLTTCSELSLPRPD